jgi:hypothetical protein
VDTLQEFYQCAESAKQDTYHNFLKSLRDGYTRAGEHIAMGSERSDDRLENLTAVAYLATGHRTMSDPTDAEGDALDKASVEYRIEYPQEDTEQCHYLSDNKREINTDYTPGYDYTFNVAITQGAMAARMLADRSQSMAGLYDGPDIATKFANLSTLYGKDLATKSISTLFVDGKHTGYINMQIPQASIMAITELYNEPKKKALQMRRVASYAEGQYSKIPDFLYTPGEWEDDVHRLLPWGTKRQHNIDVTLRRALACQNIGKALVKIFRWINNPDISLEDLKKAISKSKDSNVAGTNMSLDVERDGIDTTGYILESLLHIKAELTQMTDADRDDMQFGSYQAHFIEFYNMSFSEFRRTYMVTDADGTIDTTATKFLNLLTVCIKTDILKHLEYIDQRVRNDVALVNIDRSFGAGRQAGFIKYAGQILEALYESANGSIVEPDRSVIDRLYELRFMENANKRKVNTAKSIKDRTGININTPYAGKLNGELIGAEEEEEEEDTTYEQAGMEIGGDDDIDVEVLESDQLELVDGAENDIQGEIEEEYIGYEEED